MSKKLNQKPFAFPGSLHPLSKTALKNNISGKPAPRISPQEARKIMANRVMKGHIFSPKGRNTGVMSFAAQPGQASTVQSPASIAELARALKNDADLIFYHVYNQVEYYPTYGLQKGSLGALIDGIGNPWDQASLLVDLLREAGYTADFVFGDIDLSNDEIAAWLGTDSSNIFLASSVLTNGGIPNEAYWTGTAWRITLSHIWVKVEIDSTDYVLDPSYKSYTNIASIDLEAAMDYNQGNLLTAADTGATHGTADLWIQDVNEAGIKTELEGYASNLIDWIKTNNPTASLDEILGGKRINEIYSPVRQTSLPYESGEPEDWMTIPNEYRITMQIDYSAASIDETFYADEIYGKRLTIFFNGLSQPELRLDGSLVATGTIQSAGSWSSAEITIEHPYPVTWYDETFFLRIDAPFIGGGAEYYLIGTSFGATRKGMVDLHQRLYAAAKASGASSLSNDLLGEHLSILWHTYAAQQFAVGDLAGRMSNCDFVNHHFVGRCGLNTAIDLNFFDVTGARTALTSLAPDNEDARLKCNYAIAMHGYTLEQLTINQVNQVNLAASATRVLQIANADSTKIYLATDTNWSGDVEPNLTGYTISVSQIYDFYLQWGLVALVPEEGGQDIGGGRTADSYIAFDSFGLARGLINTYKGGAGPIGIPTWIMDLIPVDEIEDPIAAQDGAFRYRQTDLSVGSGNFPYKLAFESHYNSGRRFFNGPLGLGWKHNWQITASISSDGFRGLGSLSAIDAAASIASIYTCIDLMSDSFDILNMMTSVLTNAWWAEQLNKNIVAVQSAEITDTYVKLPDGSYYPRPGDVSTLIQNMDGSFTRTSKFQDVQNFDTDGNLETWEFPYGVTITLTYNTGKLESISNGMGRSLTLTYAGDKILTVEDDSERTVEYELDVDDQLITITDALDEDVTFEYDALGRMEKYFLPENPMDAVIDNTYDSLDRVASQLNGEGIVSNFYFAGWRTELVNDMDEFQIYHFDRLGNIVKKIDGLGFETNYLWDNRNRLLEKTMPEGNRTVWVYDSMDNALTETFKPKPGSALSDIVRTYTYHATFNKLTSAEDGNENTTTYTLDGVTGRLLTIERPEIDGKIPSVSFLYNARGQALSRIDETGIQTQFAYDGSTEVLLSVIQNTNWKATIGGTVTTSDVLTITVHDSGLGGGSKSKNYTVLGGDTLDDIADGLAAAINGDSEITDLGITAKVSGAIISLSTAPGNATTFSQSTSGGATETIALAAGLNLTKELDYSDWGDITSYTDARGNETVYTFDVKRRLEQTESSTPFNFLTKFTWDKNNKLKKLERQTGDMGHPWQAYEATYTMTGRLETFKDPDNNVVTRQYDDANRLWKITDAESRTTTFAYDGRGKLSTVTDSADVIVETRTYTENGKVATVVDARDFVTTFTRDGFDRLDKTTFPDSTFEQNALYDANGNVLTVLNRAGETFGFVFDDLNRLIEKSPEGMAVVTIQYDLAGRVLKQSTPVVMGNPASGDWLFAYDSAGRLINEEAPDNKNVSYELDENGNRTKITFPDSWYLERLYDELNRLTDIKLNGDSDPVAHFEYDDLSRRTLLEFDNGTDVDYGYEWNNDMSAVNIAFTGSTLDFAYGFNGAHQLISQSVSESQHLWHPTENVSDEYAANSLNQYVYASGSCGRLYKGYNANGCLIDDGVRRFGYDAENHLITAEDAEMSASYVYDPMHRQVQKNVDGDKTRFLYSGWRRIADYDGSMDSLICRYVYGNRVDEPLVRVASNGDLTFMYHDRQGSITALADETGVVSNRYAYSPYGESDDMDGTTFGFTGQRYDSETGLYYYKLRYYSPTLGRFLQPDPIGYAGGMNLYQYVKNDPGTYVDPLGLFMIMLPPPGGPSEPPGTPLPEPPAPPVGDPPMPTPPGKPIVDPPQGGESVSHGGEPGTVYNNGGGEGGDGGGGGTPGEGGEGTPGEGGEGTPGEGGEGTPGEGGPPNNGPRLEPGQIDLDDIRNPNNPFIPVIKGSNDSGGMKGPMPGKTVPIPRYRSPWWMN
ncbi:MAG: RHS repeat-associated core domain-containing protein [Candidatus Melainabacteria bacterium]|nr:RHS repeat-associated core domain-containing protein [Candidatus Melainabacteria bacterium]